MKIKFLSKEKLKAFVFVFAQTLVITTITVFAIVPVSCKVSASGIEIVGGDYTAPVLQNVSVLSEKSLMMEFSEPVSLSTVVVSPVLKGISDSSEHSMNEDLSMALAAACGKFGSIDCKVDFLDDGKIVIFNFGEETEVGKEYEVLGVVKDAIGNSLTFSVPFTGYNSRVPRIIMTEVHTGMATQLSSEKEANIRRLEYVSFLALSDGNLVGLELCSGMYGEAKKYVFPAVEVKKGERFVVHLRVWGEGCVSEESDELNLATSEYTSDGWRDLWCNSTSRIIGEKNDILVLRNCVDNKIVDAIMYREESLSQWSDKLKMDYSIFADVSEIYPGGDAEYGVITDSDEGNRLTASNSLQRGKLAEIMEALANNDEIEYPVKVEVDSWFIDKTTLPLR